MDAYGHCISSWMLVFVGNAVGNALTLGEELLSDVDG